MQQLSLFPSGEVPFGESFNETKTVGSQNKLLKFESIRFESNLFIYNNWQFRGEVSGPGGSCGGPWYPISHRKERQCSKLQQKKTKQASREGKNVSFQVGQARPPGPAPRVKRVLVQEGSRAGKESIVIIGKIFLHLNLV